MTDLLIVFGRTPDLAWIELQATFPQSWQRVTPEIVRGPCPENFNAEEWINRLGGAIKIARIVQEAETITADHVSQAVREATSGTSVTFGMSRYDRMSVSKPFAESVKTLLQESGYSVRFVMPKHENALSSVVVTTNKVVDCIVHGYEGKQILAVTQAVQNFASWSHRDYDRPHADPKSGMLPPKVARMLVNIALGDINNQNLTVLDPFCGMGTVLAEAVLVGAHIIGSDIKEDIVQKAQKNIAWLKSQYPSARTFSDTWYVSDAVHIASHVAPSSLDVIVTEPFMGTTSIADKKSSSVTKEKIKNVVKGLEKLYIGCLKDWRGILKDGGKVVIALPEYNYQGSAYFVKNVVDSCEMLGYTCVSGPIEYSRPHAITKRKFYIFEKKGTQTAKS